MSASPAVPRTVRTSSFPEVADIETPLGIAEYVWATSATHIGMRGTFTINRVNYSIRLDLHLREGVWQPGDKDDWSSKWNALMISRDWDYSKPGRRPDPSSAARTKAWDTLVPWLAELATGDAAEMVRAAGVLDQERKIAAKQAEIEKLKAEIEQAEQELAALQQ